MDKETALLVVAKDLFLAGQKDMNGLSKYPKGAERDPQMLFDNLADQFIAFHGKLRSGVNT